MRNITLILLSLLSIALCSCAHLDRVYTITDIEGSWESTNFGCFLLDIREDNQGYLGFAAEVDDVEAYKITDIKFVKGKFILTFQSYGESDEFEKLEGYLIGNDILLFSEPENENNADSNNSEDHLIFLRETIVLELKQSIKEKLKQIQDENP